MIDRIIAGYLAEHKRLVVPGFGAFIRKDDDGQVVFVEFLKKDDDVLAALVRREMSLNGDEASEALTAYVASIKDRIVRSGGYAVGGVGVLRTTANGAYDLEYDPEVRSDEPDAAGVRADDKAETGSAWPEGQVLDETDLSGGGETGRTENTASDLPDAGRSVVFEITGSGKEGSADSSEDISQAEKGAVESVGKEGSEGSESSLRKEVGQPSSGDEAAERGAGKPNREAVQPPQGASRPSETVPPADRKPAPVPRKKTDWVMIVAVLAAIIAIIAMVFAALSGGEPHLDLFRDAVQPAADSIPAQP